MSDVPFIVPACTEDYQLLHQDTDLLVVNKPPGLLSVPGRLAENQDCLITRVQQDFNDALIVHRLDMVTSGLMVLARGKDNHRCLSKLFQQRQVEKEYQATVYGNLMADHGLVDLPLACDWPNRPRQHVNFDYGKPSQTWYEKQRLTADGHTQLLLKPITGRSHQLRVHMASLGHPILGCEFYAHSHAKQLSPRLLLHASRLRFRHPQTQEWLNVSSSADFI